jgi:hypothetical protein
VTQVCTAKEKVDFRYVHLKKRGTAKENRIIHGILGTTEEKRVIPDKCFSTAGDPRYVQLKRRG